MEHGAVVFWWVFGGILGGVAALVALTVLFLGLFVVAGGIVKWWTDGPGKPEGKK